MRIDPNLTLAILKFCAVLATGVCGMIGLLVEYKDANRRVTKWGRRALIGTVTTTLLAVATQGIETYKQRQSDQKDRAAAEVRSAEVQNTLFQIRRAMYPIKDVQFDARAYVRMTVPQVAAYMERVNRMRATLVKSQGGFDVNSDISMPKSLWPSPSHEPVANRLLAGFGVEIGFFRTPIADFNGVGHDLYRKADLFIAATPASTSTYSLALLEDPTVVQVDAWGIPAASSQVRFNSGAIASVYDLHGAQAYVKSRYDDSDDNLEGVAEALKHSRLDFMSLTIGSVEISLRNCKPMDEGIQVCSLSDVNDFRGIELTGLTPSAEVSSQL
jgi:hypothetical protein